MPSLLAFALAAALAPEQPQRPPSLRANVDLVLVPVTVLDRRGATVSGLVKEQFQLFENKVPQRILAFSRDDAPCSIGLIFDLSGSMKNRMAEAYSSTRAFFHAVNPDDEVMLITFSSRPEAQSGFADAATAESRLRSARPGGRTALIDAVVLGLQRMKNARHARKAMVIVSDGMDNYSRYSRGELMGKAREADVQMYTVAVHDPPRNKKPIELQDERRGLFLLEDLAESTGGLSLTVRGLEEVGRVGQRIGTALHDRYVLGYRPPETDDQHRWRRIQVKLKIPNVQAYARTGYYGP